MLCVEFSKWRIYGLESKTQVNTIHIPGYLPCVVNFSVFAIIAIRIS